MRINRVKVNRLQEARSRKSSLKRLQTFNPSKVIADNDTIPKTVYQIRCKKSNPNANIKFSKKKAKKVAKLAWITKKLSVIIYFII